MTTPDLTRHLLAAGELFAAGWISAPEAPPVVRFAHGLAAHLRHVPLSPYEGTRLYPVGPSGTGDNLYALPHAATGFHYCLGFQYDLDALRRKAQNALASASPDPDQAAALEALASALTDYPRVGGYTHSIPHYGRLLAEGLDAYRARITSARSRLPFSQEATPGELTPPLPQAHGTWAGEGAGGEASPAALYDSLLILLDAIADYHSRVVDLLESSPQDAPEAEHNRRLLLAAYAQVPFCPLPPPLPGEGAGGEAPSQLATRDSRLATPFAAAMIATCFFLHLDGTDDLGRFDQFMLPYYEQSLAAGEITPDEAREWIGEMWGKIDRATGWNVAIGGLKADGTSAVNALTRLCLEAAVGRRRPNLALRIPPDMPEDVWEATFDCLASGCGLPALYNELEYRRAIREAHLNLSEADLADFAFGGCTELMVHGKSNVGSLEGDLNLPLVLVETLHNRLLDCPSFLAFLAAFKQDLAAYILRNVEQWNRNQASKALHHPLPMRSLLIDDCVENGREYNAGGARYNWCIVNVMGLANVADSLAALKQVFYGVPSDGTTAVSAVAADSEVIANPSPTGNPQTKSPLPLGRGLGGRAGDPGSTPEDFLAAFRADFVGYDSLQRRLKAAPHFGNDDPYVDDIMRDVSTFVFEQLRQYAPWRGGRYLPACLMFTTYAWFGEPVGATPDGRHAGAPLADSAGAVQGRDLSGPTALLQSATKIPHHLAPGTLVTNLRLAKKFFRGEGRRKLRDLLLTYFRLGGMQLQMTVVDQATLQAALEDPERYGDLIIRVGGYSEYWSRLDDALRRSILERVEHE